MSRFPRTEAEITALALLMVDGLTQAPDDFPSPPVPGADLQAQRERCNAACRAPRRPGGEVRYHTPPVRYAPEKAAKLIRPSSVSRYMTPDITTVTTTQMSAASRHIEENTTL